MNRTIEQWRKVVPATKQLENCISDLQELARQLEVERAAWIARRTELLRNRAAELVRRKDAEAQRDELLAVLEYVADETCGWLHGDAMEKARAAIQKVRGGE